MTSEERRYFLLTYGIDYVKEDETPKYELGHYQATDNQSVSIPYKFLKKEEYNGQDV